MGGVEDVVVAVDLGGTSLLCGAANGECEVVEYTERPSLAHLECDRVIANLKDAIADLIARLDADKYKPKAISIGVPGFVDIDCGIVRKAANLPYMTDVPLAGILGEAFGIPVYLGHDIDLATLGEAYYGAGKGTSHLICITVGTGIGMGMMFEGSLYRGWNDGAGNLGHMVVDRNVLPSRIPDEGIIENLASGPSIRTKAVAALKRGSPGGVIGELCGGKPEKVDTPMVFEAARMGDELSLDVIRETAGVLGIGIANVINLLSPEKIVIGGGVAQAGGIFLEAVVAEAKKHVYSYPDIESRVVQSLLGDKAALVGAAHIVWKRLRAGDAD